MTLSEVGGRWGGAESNASEPSRPVELAKVASTLVGRIVARGF